MTEIRMLGSGGRGLLQEPCSTSPCKVMAITGTLGGWAKGKPIARGMGAHHNDLAIIKPHLEERKGITKALDDCPKVKVKSEGGSNG